jgi:hypothetical protein
VALYDRYLRTGTSVPAIYPYGTAALVIAISDAVLSSRRFPGQHEIIAVRGGERTVLQVYEGGELTWVMRRELAE